MIKTFEGLRVFGFLFTLNKHHTKEFALSEKREREGAHRAPNEKRGRRKTSKDNKTNL